MGFCTQARCDPESLWGWVKAKALHVLHDLQRGWQSPEGCRWHAIKQVVERIYGRTVSVTVAEDCKWRGERDVRRLLQDTIWPEQSTRERFHASIEGSDSSVWTIETKARHAFRNPLIYCKGCWWQKQQCSTVDWDSHKNIPHLTLGFSEWAWITAVTRGPSTAFAAQHCRAIPFFLKMSHVSRRLGRRH